MPRLRLTLAYHGGALHGWQAQRSGLPTVQGHLMAAWKSLTDEDATFTAAGRTDAGVHARAQVAHVDTVWPHATTLDDHGHAIKVMDGLNRYLPPTIRILHAAPAAPDFHARFSATARTYQYRLVCQRVMPPEWLGLAGHSHTTQPTLMAQALTHLPLGTHDFSAFRDAECQSKSPLCTLTERKLHRDDHGHVIVTFTANHFLQHMVRNLMGTLVKIGQGQRPVDDLATSLASRQRTTSGPNLSPSGLYLHHITYPTTP